VGTLPLSKALVLPLNNQLSTFNRCCDASPETRHVRAPTNLCESARSADRFWAILDKLQVRANLQADDVTTRWLREDVVHGDGDILRAEHLVLVDEITLLS
jgi:hypothetical protein